jgi:hypothetical protein
MLTTLPILALVCFVLALAGKSLKGLGIVALPVLSSRRVQHALGALGLILMLATGVIARMTRKGQQGPAPAARPERAP